MLSCLLIAPMKTMYVILCMYVSSFIGKHGMSKRIHLQREYRNKTSMYKFKVRLPTIVMLCYNK